MFEFIWKKLFGWLWDGVASETKGKTLGEVAASLCFSLAVVQTGWIYILFAIFFVNWLGWHPAISISLLIILSPIYLLLCASAAHSNLLGPLLSVSLGCFVYLSAQSHGFDRLTGIICGAWASIIWFVLLWYSWTRLAERD